MFPGGGRVEVWNDGEVCVFDPMDRDLDDYNIVPGDVPKLLRLLAEPMARWHHFMREMVVDEVSLVKRRRKNPEAFLTKFHAQIRAIITKARGSRSGRKSMSRLRTKSRRARRSSRRSSNKMTRKQKRAANRAAFRKLRAKRRGKKVSRRYKAVRRTSRRGVRRTSKGRFARVGRRTGRKAVRRTGRRYARKSRRYSGVRARGAKGRFLSRAVTHNYAAADERFAEMMTPGGFANPRRRGKSRRRNPGVKHFKDGSMLSYQDDGYVTLYGKYGNERHYELDSRGLRRFLSVMHKAQGLKSAERLLPRGAILRQVNPKRRGRKNPHGVGRKSAAALKRILRSHGYKCKNPRRGRKSRRRNCGR
jgi:hypothetical protein